MSNNRISKSSAAAITYNLIAVACVFYFVLRLPQRIGYTIAECLVVIRQKNTATLALVL